MEIDLSKSTKGSYALLSGLFNVGLALFCWRKRPEQITWKDWGMLALATFRMSRLVAYDTVMQTYRSPVVEVVPHDSGAGETTQARPGRGIKRAIGELIACPVCNGTWISAGLVYGLCRAPNYTRTLITVMSAVGAAEVLQGAFEALQWNGELARQKTGAQKRANRAAQEADAAREGTEDKGPGGDGAGYDGSEEGRPQPRLVVAAEQWSFQPLAAGSDPEPGTSFVAAPDTWVSARRPYSPEHD